MSGIYDSIYATMLAEGRSYEDISQSVERLHEYLSLDPYVLQKQSQDFW